MRWETLARVAMTAAVLTAGGCDRFGQAPQAEAPAAEAPEPAAAPVEIRTHVGETYAAFAADAGARYTPDALGLTAADRARVWRAMAAGEAGQWLSGGGAEGLVFRGCAETGCGDGVAVVAIDAATGAPFVAVRDVGGSDVLKPNERLEALLRLNSPTRGWDDPAAAPASAAAGQP